MLRISSIVVVAMLAVCWFSAGVLADDKKKKPAAKVVRLEIKNPSKQCKIAIEKHQPPSAERMLTDNEQIIQILLTKVSVKLRTQYLEKLSAANCVYKLNNKYPE